MEKEPKGRITVRIQDRVRTRLKQLAAADKREEGDYVRKVLWDHVEEAERDGRLDGAPGDQSGNRPSLAATNGARRS